MIEPFEGHWRCTECGHEWSAMLGDDEVPEVCECRTNDEYITAHLPQDTTTQKATAKQIRDYFISLGHQCHVSSSGRVFLRASHNGPFLDGRRVSEYRVDECGNAFLIY